MILILTDYGDKETKKPDWWEDDDMISWEARELFINLIKLTLF